MSKDSSTNQSPMPSAGTRKVGVLLSIGVFFLPIIFSWFLLRPGYSLLARALALSWLAFFLFVALDKDGSNNVSGPIAPATVSVNQPTQAANQKDARAVEILRLPKNSLVCFDRGDWDLMLQSIWDRNAIQVKLLLESARCMYTSDDMNIKFLDPASKNSALIQLPSGRAGFVLLQDIGK